MTNHCLHRFGNVGWVIFRTVSKMTCGVGTLLNSTQLVDPLLSCGFVRPLNTKGFLRLVRVRLIERYDQARRPTGRRSCP